MCVFKVFVKILCFCSEGGTPGPLWDGKVSVQNCKNADFRKRVFFHRFLVHFGVPSGSHFGSRAGTFPKKSDPELYLSGFFATPFLRWFFERFRTPKGSPNDVKMYPKTVLFCFRRNLVFEQHYGGLAYIS